MIQKQMQFDGSLDSAKFSTHRLESGATPIAAAYQDRWQIQFFFKAPKENLNIQTFVGTSAHAVKIQIWTASMVGLILRLLQLQPDGTGLFRGGWLCSR